MTIQTKWVWGPMKVTDVDQLQGVIIGVEWKCVAIDETGINTSKTGVLDLPSPNPNEFVTLDNVTVEIVNGWIAQYMTGQSDIETQVSEELNSMLNPVVKVLPIPTTPQTEETPRKRRLDENQP